MFDRFLRSIHLSKSCRFRANQGVQSTNCVSEVCVPKLEQTGSELSKVFEIVLIECILEKPSLFFAGELHKSGVLE